MRTRRAISALGVLSLLGLALGACGGSEKVASGTASMATTMSTLRTTTTAAPTTTTAVPVNAVDQLAQVVCRAGTLPVLDLPYLASRAYAATLGLSAVNESYEYTVTKIDPDCDGLSVIGRTVDDEVDGQAVIDSFLVKFTAPAAMQGWIDRYTACQSPTGTASVRRLWPVCEYENAAQSPTVHAELAALPVLQPQIETDGLPDLTVEYDYASLAQVPCSNKGEIVNGMPLFTLVNKGSGASPSTIELTVDGSTITPLLFRGLEPGERIALPGTHSVVVDPHNRIAESDKTNNAVTPPPGPEYVCQ